MESPSQPPTIWPNALLKAWQVGVLDRLPKAGVELTDIYLLLLSCPDAAVKNL